MPRLLIARQGYADIDEIAEFIRRDNPARAKAFVDEIAARIERIAERPFSFPERSEWLPGLRSALHGRYLILFRCNDGEVIVLRVIHGAWNIAGLFKDD